MFASCEASATKAGGGCLCYESKVFSAGDLRRRHAHRVNLLPRDLDIRDRIRTRIDRRLVDIAVCRYGYQGDSLPWQTAEAIVPRRVSSCLGHVEVVQS